MKEIIVNTTHQTYSIHIGDQFTQLPQLIQSLGLAENKFFIITDSNVAKYHLEEVTKNLETVCKEVRSFIVPAGEVNKNLGTIESIYRFLIQNQCDRKSVLVALGGGVIGDMTGFTAASFMRGIKYIQIPTSLLAQVDSSIGGKTGVDLDGYKNVVGAFKQPEMVYMNYKVFDTLPQHEFENGMAEVVKHGLILDKDYYAFLHENKQLIRDKDDKTLEKMIARSCEIKRDVVEIDEKETGLRAHLNFGHTIGHAIERLHHFTTLHGECITIGMCMALKASVDRGNISEEEMNRFVSFAEYFNLPTIEKMLDVDMIYNELFYDKKTMNNQINFILLNKIGESIMVSDLTESEIKLAIGHFKA